MKIARQMAQEGIVNYAALGDEREPFSGKKGDFACAPYWSTRPVPTPKMQKTERDFWPFQEKQGFLRQ